MFQKEDTINFLKYCCFGKDYFLKYFSKNPIWSNDFIKSIIKRKMALNWTGFYSMIIYRGTRKTKKVRLFQFEPTIKSHFLKRQGGYDQ